jgi:hypothetical protein
VAIPKPSPEKESSHVAEGTPREEERRSGGMLRTVGLGLITGAADDDPSAIGTYASAGAAIGPAFLWTAPVAFPMMCAVVYLSAKLGQREHVLVECAWMDRDGRNLRSEYRSGGDVVYVRRLTLGVDYVHEILNHTKDKEKRSAQADHRSGVR